MPDDLEQSSWSVETVLAGAAARTLAKAGTLVTLIDHNPYSTFQPLLYQVATAGMSMSDVSYPIRTYAAKWPNVRARRGALSTVLPEKRRVELDDGSTLDYDFLVLATGVTTNWYNVPGAPENAQPLYSLNDAAALRRRLQHCLEDAVVGRRDSVHVVVVGGGRDRGRDCRDAGRAAAAHAAADASRDSSRPDERDAGGALRLRAGAVQAAAAKCGGGWAQQWRRWNRMRWGSSTGRTCRAT
ncbi:FAD-dependent oxidoreductase [Nonomuraea angiospora]|uniref:NAD(P)/FAD-dependent oxidoreductase n=1 Tax=Nonomuraea angiospora TaxID=46172 RepID=UPI00341B268A